MIENCTTSTWPSAIAARLPLPTNALSFLVCAKNIIIFFPGASSGIGAELARQYASMGASLFIGARRQDLLAEMCQVCTQLGASKCEFAKLDVTDEQSCK